MHRYFMQPVCDADAQSYLPPPWVSGLEAVSAGEIGANSKARGLEEPASVWVLSCQIIRQSQHQHLQHLMQHALYMPTLWT